jgi:hypothetical protein
LIFADFSTQQLVDRQAETFSDRVQDRHFQRGFRIGLAAHGAVHGRVHSLEAAHVHVLQARHQAVIDHRDGGARRLAVAGAVVAAPGLDRLRLAEADAAVAEPCLHDQVAASDGRREPDPEMRAADRQRDDESLDGGQRERSHQPTSIKVSLTLMPPVIGSKPVFVITYMSSTWKPNSPGSM